MRIVEICNYDKNTEPEIFLNIPRLSKEKAQRVAGAINECFRDDYPRFWLVVDDDYVPKTSSYEE